MTADSVVAWDPAYRAEVWDTAYDVMLGECRWQVHRMTGGLGARIDVLRRV